MEPHDKLRLSGLVKDPYLLAILKTTSLLQGQAFALLELEDEAQELPNQEQISAFSGLQKGLGTYVSQLRGQNRRLAHLVHETKAQTGASRAEIDRLHLSLQNLYYEQRHLQGEISACEDFPHTYKQLPLISEQEFIAKYPGWDQEQAKHEFSEAMEPPKHGEEGLMRARIEDEHNERSSLERQKQELIKRKLELARENAKRKEQLVNLDKDLETFIEAAKPIQKTFEKEY
ncbi:MAG: hypothetical protein M1828_001480 [Chrysothrix sp. TS-e1954]|nr:MAG: hypothetical protein M1828_001480 [Chrysothrix sp. TS-e1954]